MINWFICIDLKIQAALISAITSITVLLLSWLIRIIYERTSLTHKLNKEFKFEQKKKLKEEIAKNKLQLINSAEELNNRLWNFSQNIDKKWHKVDEKYWSMSSKYYLQSFVYRFLTFIYLLIETERETLSVDTTIADANDILYLKYVKTLKDIFTDVDLFAGFDYNTSINTHHFYKNDLIGYGKFVANGSTVIDFDEFQLKLKDDIYQINNVFKYFSNIENSKDDKKLNILKCTHLLILAFLNKYGHDYQKSPIKKMKMITDKYKNELCIIDNFEKFVNKSKLKKEFKNILKQLKCANK